MSMKGDAMVRTASAAAVLVFAAGLGTAALAQEPQTAKAAVATAPAAPVAVAVPIAAPTPAASPLSQAMQAQAQADAPPAPPPPAAPVAAPSVAVAAETLAPAVKPVAKVAFAPPPASAVVIAAAPVAAPAPVAAVAVVAAPVQVAVFAPPPVAPAVEPVATKVSVPAPAPVAPASQTPPASALVARRVTDAAGAFDAWTEKAGRIDGKFADAGGVSGALIDSSAFQAKQLEEGAVAFGALVALQDPVFVQSAHELASMGGDHEAAAAILLKEPRQVMTLPGADGAAAFTAEALAKRAQAVITAGKAVRQASYSMQVDPWAKLAVTTPDKRLAEAKARSSTAIALDGPASTLLMKRLVELRTSRQSHPGAALTGASTPMVTRSLALAAMIVLGEADEEHAAKLTPILLEAKTDDCLKMAKLNLFQCLSVAGPHYEDAFCVGQHGLGEAAQCIASAAGVVVPTPLAAPVLIAAAGPAPVASVSVPIALLAESGPERSAAYAPSAPPAPLQLLAAAPQPEAAPAAPLGQPSWARDEEAAPRAYARQAAPEPAAPRYDRGMAYRWDRQTRSADYTAPGYAAPAYGYADPRQGYGQYAEPARRLAPPNGYDPRNDDEDDGDAAPLDTRAQQARGVWGYR